MAGGPKHIALSPLGSVATFCSVARQASRLSTCGGHQSKRRGHVCPGARTYRSCLPQQSLPVVSWRLRWGAWPLFGDTIERGSQDQPTRAPGYPYPCLLGLITDPCDLNFAVRVRGSTFTVDRKEPTLHRLNILDGANRSSPKSGQASWNLSRHPGAGLFTSSLVHLVKASLEEGWESWDLFVITSERFLQAASDMTPWPILIRHAELTSFGSIV